MSYPRKLHILIIEDEQDPIDGYRELLGAFRDRFPSVTPTVVRSYNDAKKALEGPRIFHIVILDLNLPIDTKQDPAEGLAPGEQLLELAANRESYPIPVLLVISGKLGVAHHPLLRQHLERSFWHWEIVKKPITPEEFEKALRKANEYTDVGIHIQDAGQACFPTLSPGEDHMLRRCVLSMEGCLGVDLEWWTAETGPSLSRPTQNDGPTKVLMGRFLLDDAMEESRATFFKIEPAGNAEYVCRDVRILDHKLSHVKLQHTGVSRRRCLIVTQSVTDGRPVALDRYIYSDDDSVDGVIPHLIADVATQLAKMGGVTDDEVFAAELLWKHFAPGTLEQAVHFADQTLLAPGKHEDPIAVFKALEASQARIWVSRRNCTHGDLNATNVAVDLSTSDRPHAFVFDAGGIHADVDTRDLAYLEVTTLLFVSDPAIRDYVAEVGVFYAASIDPGVPPNALSLPLAVRRTLAVISAIRTHVASLKNADTYPLILFNAAMMQLGGLVSHPKRNKIANPEMAYLLAAWSATWLKITMPTLFVSASSAKGQQ